MLLKYKKYLLIFLLALAASSCYWLFYKSHWGVSINKESSWSYSFQPKGKSTFNDIQWEQTKEKREISEQEKSHNLIFRTEFSLKDYTKILKASLEYEYKYSAKVLINGIECSNVARDLISSSLEGDKIKIYEYWRPRKITLNQEVISSHLKNGKNTITIIVYNVGAIKTLESTKKQLSFLTRGASNDLESNFKITKPVSSFSSSTLPIFKISTGNSVIPDEPKINSSLEIITNKTNKNNNISSTGELYNIKIEQRGNTSQTFAKKSYSFNIYDIQKKKINQALLGLPKSHKWVLYGPYADKSLIRNALTYSIYRQMGNYAPKTAFIDLVVNNNYRGIYLLIEKIQVGSNHLNINPLVINNSDSIKASGGYVLEVDRNDWRGKYPINQDTASFRTSYMVEVPKKKKVPLETQRVIQSQFNTFEKHLYENDSIYNYLDLNSFVDYLIITEFTKNIDGYCLSTFLYNKEIGNVKPKFYIGPIWDYNFSLGLTDYHQGFNPEGYVYNSSKYIPFWWNKLLNDKVFKTALQKRFFELRKTVLSNEKINEHIDSLALIVENSTHLNFEKWPVLNSPDFWPNYYLGKTYSDEIKYLKSWTEKRLVFLDNDILAKEKKGEMYYEIAIRNKPKWLSEVKKKAKKRKITIDEMIKIDAKYMAGK
jgi:hypothetical protein